jgi:hypothetical membrane protein
LAVGNTYSGERPPPGRKVDRSARYGAVLYVVGAVQFLVGMVVSGLLYGPPTYDLQRNAISDLQAVNCGLYDGHQVCSPAHLVANSSVALIGLLLIVGSMLIRTALSPGRTRSVGVGLLILAGLGAIGNGFTPEDVNPTGDFLTALLAFVGANLALIVIGVTMSRDAGWRGFGAYTKISGVVGLVAFVLYLANVTGPLGTGGMEWLIVVPIVQWMFVVGAHIVRIPTDAPRGITAKS